MDIKLKKSPVIWFALPARARGGGWKVGVAWEVKKYGVSGEFVLGYADAVTDRHPAGDFNTKGGWFFLDTKTHEVWEHLTKTEMRIRALKNGVYWIPWMKTVGFVPRKFWW
jgi:hypothetical protein